MTLPTKLHKILRIDEEIITNLGNFMDSATNKENVVGNLESDIDALISDRLKRIGLAADSTTEEVIRGLTLKIGENEDQLYNHIGLTRDNFNFDKFVSYAFEITTAKRGFFLKKENAENILRKQPPEEVLKYLGYKSVGELIEKEDIFEVFSALRFVETNEWMHSTFEVAYSDFTADDFEERDIELKVLSDQWHDVALKFVEKKHHNVSHLKEFGVIFLNPINQTAPGAVIRDFALFFHYFHEIAFYSKLFKLFAKGDNFSENLKAALRGDLPEKKSVEPGEWLIIQRYLWKEDLSDPRLFLPRVNPESLHWHKGEVDLINFGKKNPETGLDFWEDLDYVASYFTGSDGGKDLVSFDMEDNAMTFVAEQRGKKEEIWYHQQEALWNELFRRYVGKEELDKLLIDNFDKGTIIVN